MKIKEAGALSAPENVLSQNEEHKASASDYIEETIGEVSLWQVVVVLVASLTRYVAMINLTSIVFLTPKTDFVCSEFIEKLNIVPQNGTCYDSCKNYIYHSDIMKRSLISDFALICDRKWLGSFTQTMLILGVVFGVTIFGWISDKFGRRVSIILSSVLNIISMISSSFSPSYWIFNILRFLTGIATGGSLIICLTVVMEIVGKTYREAAMAFCILPDTVSQASLALYAYYLPNWDTYILSYSIVSAIIIFGVCFIPESPRWLISRGKVDQAVKILSRAASFNKKSSSHIREKVLFSIKAMKTKTIDTQSLSYLDFFKTKSVAMKTLSIALIWTVLYTNYYGIYQYMTLLELDVYATVVIMGLIQIPLCPLEILICKILDRRTCVTLGLLLTSLTMVILIFTPKNHWTSTVFGVIGFSSSSVCFMIIYLFIGELFPTSLRNMAFGIASAAGKTGSMVAPFIANITPVWIPSVIFAVLSLIAAIASYTLPETKGTNLKDVED